MNEYFCTAAGCSAFHSDSSLLSRPFFFSHSDLQQLRLADQPTALDASTNSTDCLNHSMFFSRGSSLVTRSIICGHRWLAGRTPECFPNVSTEKSYRVPKTSISPSTPFKKSIFFEFLSRTFRIDLGIFASLETQHFRKNGEQSATVVTFQQTFGKSNSYLQNFEFSKFNWMFLSISNMMQNEYIYF